MKTSAPKKTTLCVALILAVVAIIGKVVAIPFISQYAFVILAVAFAVLCLGCIFKDL